MKLKVLSSGVPISDERTGGSLMSMTRTLSFVAFAALFVLAAIAASNPKVEPPECEGTEVETCEVDGPSAGSVAATADCTNFTFRLSGVVGGSERVVRKEEYSGGEDCMEPKTLSDETKNLAAQVSWEVVSSNASGVVRNSGSGAEVEIPRINGACRATCTFEVTVSPSVCDPPAPVVRAAEAVFVDDVRVDVGTPPRLCCVSTAHTPHLFTMEGCDCPVLRIDPPGVATVVTQDCSTAVVKGISACEGAVAVAEAPCGIGTNTFDVVEIGPLVVSGLCGCFSTSDSTDDDEDAPSVETMDFGPNATGFSLSLPVAPPKWATDARWLVGRDGWMPVAGNFADGEQQTLTTAPDVISATFDAWFDCEPDGVRASDEPKRRVTGTIARLGTLKIERDPNAEGEQGPTNRCEESFAPGEFAVFTNLDVLPVGREHTLKVVGTMPRYKDKSMTIPLGPVPGSGNSWRLKIPEDCADGLFWVELEDPLHSCTSIVKRLCVQACLCMSCDEFAKEVLENGCIDVTFGLGRTSSGGGKAPVRFVLDRTDVLPDISSESVPDGRMDVSTSNGVMTVAFKRKGEQAPMAVYTLTPGADAFTMRETREGSLRKTVVWSLADGVWTMVVFDETVSPRELVRRDVRTSRPTSRGVAHTLARGGEAVETETEEIDGIGPMPIRETRGVGAEARTTWKSYYKSGAEKGRVRSELSPDGSWTMYSYDATGRVESVVSPFGDSSPVLDDNHAVIGYNGVVRRMTYSYAPVDGRDTGTLLADEPRTIVESVGSDASGWTEVSRRYAAHFVENGVRVEVSERAATPGAAYGAAGNQRTTSSYLWYCRGAGRPVRREAPDGLVSLWSYDFTPSNVVVETATIPAQLAGASVPACPLMVGIPYRTTIQRTIEDLRGDVFREETYVVTDSGRELLSWTDFERDAAGHELRRESSDGSIVGRAWSCCGPEWEMDERGIVTVYSYDAIGRQATMTRSGVTTLWNYDLAGNATNVTRFADALMASSSTGYDSAGRLRWNIGEDGVRTEYAYSTSPDGGEVRTTIRAANTDCATTNTVISFRDGATKALYLNNVLKSTEVHELFASATYEGTNGLASVRWTRSETDFLGRTVSESRPSFGGSTIVISNLYDSAGRLLSTSSSSLIPHPSSPTLCVSAPLRETIYLYDEHNDRVATVSDRNFNNAIDWTGPDLVSSNATRYVSIGGDWWRETRQWSIQDDDSAVSRLMGVRRSRVTGLGANGLASESVSIDQRGNATTNRVWRNRAAAEEVSWVKYPTSTTPAVTTSTNGLVRSSTSQTGVTTTFAYDAFKREVSQTDGRGTTTRTVYDNLGRVASTIDALGYATIYGYDALGRQVSVTDPLTNTVTTAYDAEGHIVSQRGATYPVDYSYDEFGDKVSMTTYRNINAIGDVTRWLRDEATGLVTNKVYADGKGPRYTYTPDGRLATRTWARGIVTTYSYDDNGALTNTVYSDGTPTISLAYNRAGQQTCAEDAAGVTTFLYDNFGAVTNETVVGVAGTNTIERFYDNFGRSLGYSLNGVRQSTLAYDPATGRLASMQIPPEQSNNPNNQTIKQFSWNYLAGSDLKSSLDYPNGLAASWAYDANGQLLQVKNAFPTNTISQYDYAYDAAGRRVQIARSGSAMSENRTDVYGYNARGELVFSRGDAEGAENDFAYEYDNIGNRLTSLDLGTNRTYIANNLNQYTSISNSALSASPREAFTPQFDDDGNQTLIKTETGIWSVTYNGENRPTLWSCVQSNNSNNTNNQTILSMSYDRMGRRVAKNDQRFVYDGYLQIANFEHSTSNIELQTFVWDPSEPVATRPLVWNRDTSAAYYTHDGNKNVSEVVETCGVVSAHYWCAPFGCCVAENSRQNNFWRFSSEYFDKELGLVYYNFRHLDTVCGRWLSFDPLGSFGGENELNFARNDAIGNFDNLGEIGVRFLTKKVEITDYILFERRVEKWVDVNSPEDVHINYVKSIVSMTRGGAVHSSLGQFSAKVAFDKKSCTVCVILSIKMRDDLAEESSANVVYRVTPHKTGRDDGSTGVYKDGKLDPSHSPLKEAVMAHERGHADAYLKLVKPEFESEMKDFDLSNKGVISEDEAKKIRRIHDRIDNRHVKESGQYANDAEASWYMGNGFNRKQVGEYYEYSK